MREQGIVGTHPIAGPRKGIKMKTPDGSALVSTDHKSAIEPPPTARGEPPNVPAKNRQMHREAMF